MEINEPYPMEVTIAINAFVDRIEQVLLQSGITRAERTGVCTEVETQIHMMIERRLEAGAELNVELVKGIIESMDPPESYAKPVEPLQSSESIATSASVPIGSTTTEKVPEKRPAFDYVRKLLHRPARTKPSLDWVAIVGLTITCFGLFFLLVSIPSRSEFAAVWGIFWIFVGVIASGVSFWRIRHSNGLLTGQRIASAGVLALPIVFSNFVLGALLFATPFGRFLGAIVLALAMIYANYRLIKYAMRWLSSYSAAVSQPVVDDIKPELDAGQSSMVIATS